MCLFPQKAILNDLGRIKFDHEGDIQIPCGKCIECLSKRAIEWATRARHEISTHDENCFLTLTYDEDNLPGHLVVKTEFQKFMKKLRKHTKKNIRYMVSHEYGSNTFRPHHHAILFGYNPPNQKQIQSSKKGEPLFTSDSIEKLWGKGFHSIGTANEKTAYYIASYSIKGKKHSFPDPNTGEIINVSDCMDTSKRPAIGLNYFKNNFQQIINSKEIMPRYYLKKLKDVNIDLYEYYENERQFKMINKSSHEKYAKQIIQSSKLKNSIFREVNIESEKEFKNRTYILKKDRGDYATYLREEKNEISNSL